MSEEHQVAQQLWLDYIHLHPDIGALRLWPTNSPVEYFALVTLSQSPWSMASMLPLFTARGYQDIHRYAMADCGLLAALLAPHGDGPWLILVELQATSLPRQAREVLLNLVQQDGSDTIIHQPGAMRPWPMPDWNIYQLLARAHPLAAWLSIAGPRVHHAGFDCQRLSHSLNELDILLQEHGLTATRQGDSIFPVSALVEQRFYPTCSQLLPFAAGDEHRVPLGGLALIQKQLGAGQERSAEILLPPHALCEIF